MSNTDNAHLEKSTTAPEGDVRSDAIPESQGIEDAEADRQAMFRELRALVEATEPGLLKSEDSRWRCACCGSDQVFGYRAMWVGGTIDQTADSDEPLIPDDDDPWPVEGVSNEYSCMACGRDTVLVDHAESKSS